MESQITLFPSLPSKRSDVFPDIAISEEVSTLLARNAVVAIGVSGGKDSQAAAIATVAYLDKVGHTGKRILVHADLGRVEWKDSLPICEELAAKLGLELLVEKRAAGDLMDRWRTRWKNNLARYGDLSCVKLILPWSTPSMRFCTSELKVAVITSALKRRFPGEDIVNVSGIRRQESASRRKAPISKAEPKLKRRGNIGVDWHPIIDWLIEDVFDSIKAAGLRLHEAYVKFKTSRVSCVFCIMSSESDMIAASFCEDNRDIYVEMVELEAASTFAFQGSRWLADVAPHLLSEDLLARVQMAKSYAQRRQELESLIPEHLWYVKGWPTVMPTRAEAELLAKVRIDVAKLLDVPVKYTTADQVLLRYESLMAEKARKLTTIEEESELVIL